MSSIAKGFILGVAAPAECIGFLQRVSLNFPPGSAVALIIVADFPNGKRNSAGHDIWTILGYCYFHSK